MLTAIENADAGVGYIIKEDERNEMVIIGQRAIPKKLADNVSIYKGRSKHSDRRSMRLKKNTMISSAGSVLDDIINRRSTSVVEIQESQSSLSEKRRGEFRKTISDIETDRKKINADFAISFKIRKEIDDYLGR